MLSKPRNKEGTVQGKPSVATQLCLYELLDPIKRMMIDSMLPL